MTTRYFHGGEPGLNVGDRILPPSITRRPKCSEASQDNSVYVSTDPAIAFVFRARYQGGGFYEVVPDGPVEVDSDWGGTAGEAWRASSATVVAVLDPSDFVEELVQWLST